MAMEDRDYFQQDRDRRRRLDAPTSTPQRSKPLGPIHIPAYDQAMAARRRRDLQAVVIWVLVAAVGVLLVLLLRR